MFSGGLDSTYLAWKFLTQNKKIHLHHISIRNDTLFPWEVQDKACKKIIPYFKERGFNFEYSESVFEFFGLRSVGYDIDLQLVCAQKVAQNLRPYKVDVCIGLTTHDINRTPTAVQKIPQIQDIWRPLLVRARVGGDNINTSIQFPLVDDNITKPEMIKDMPKDLLDLTWSCRTPADNKPCGSCHACRERLPLGN